MNNDRSLMLKLLDPIMHPRICEWENCHLEYPSDFLCMEHIKRDHKVRQSSKCQWRSCDYETNNPRNNANHLKKHFNNIEGICLTCKTRFKWRFDLKRHVSNFHKNEKTKTFMVKIHENSVLICRVDDPKVLNKKIALLLN
eukprot:NODE_412_length_9112_cov_0.674692.p6 type:complete len:141 gc:universal NODE_412_length_9112_cov_0.674692:5246-4824(-)